MSVPLATALDRPRAVALAILIAAAATIAGAYVFQFGLGYEPCKLCLEQRIPYYVAMPLALLTACVPAGKYGRVVGTGLALLALVFIVSAGLGLYHAGVEWAFWLGPSDCGGTGAAPTSIEDFRNRLDTIHVVSCTQAAWRFLGLSLAGWNALISLALAALALWGARLAAGGPAAARRHLPG